MFAGHHMGTDGYYPLVGASDEDLLKEIKRRELQVQAAIEFMSIDDLVEGLKARLDAYIFILKPKQDQQVEYRIRQCFDTERVGREWGIFELELLKTQLILDSGRLETGEDKKPEEGGDLG